MPSPLKWYEKGKRKKEKGKRKKKKEKKKKRKRKHLAAMHGVHHPMSLSTIPMAFSF